MYIVSKPQTPQDSAEVLGFMGQLIISNELWRRACWLYLTEHDGRYLEFFYAEGRDFEFMVGDWKNYKEQKDITRCLKQH
jgi:hypothetical protein